MVIIVCYLWRHTLLLQNCTNTLQSSLGNMHAIYELIRLSYTLIQKTVSFDFFKPIITVATHVWLSTSVDILDAKSHYT